MSNNFPIVGVGASAGGLEAFEELLRHLPGDLGMALVFVQHLAPGHPSLLVELLCRSAKMPVREVKEKDWVKPDHVYIIPPNTRLTISRGVLHVAPREEVRALPLPIDSFFFSLARERHHRSVGIILSGNANDGTSGLKAIKAAGGVTFAQDKKSAKFGGMPESAINSGSVDFILTPKKMAEKLEQIVLHPWKTARWPKHQIARAVTSKELQTIFAILKRGTGVDFTLYKRNTILRRIERRLGLHRMTFAEYVKLLRRDPKESKELMEDFLIHVTGFFRDPSVFKKLKRSLFPKILKGKNFRKPCRIWVPGCSSGEEAYSIAMSLIETLGPRARQIPVKIFGTDISELSIEKARKGIFKKNEVAGVSAVRLRRFFTKVGEGWEINKNIRDLCVFGKHDLVQEPPFSNIDLISCRNLLIYLGLPLQEKAVSAFHYALRPNGFLLLGTAETLGKFSDLFQLVDRKSKLYLKKGSSVRSVLGSLQDVVEAVEETNIAHETDRMMRGELQATNEELRVANEELQSSNEELETAQEELQSTNEELTTLNEEIQNRNEELHLAVEFSDSIVETIREPLLILDQGLKVVRANAAFYESFNLAAGKVEGRHIYSLAKGQWNIPRLRLLLEKIIPQKREISNFEIEYKFPGRGYKTLLFNARQISRRGGVPMILVAIDLLSMENRVAKKIAEFSEKEKERVGKDLHDGLGQTMTGIALLSKSLEKRLGNKRREELQTAVKITKLVKQGIFEISRMARGLTPIGLENVGGIIPALAEMAEQVKFLFGVDCVFECKEETIILDHQCKINLYYIVQEAVNNAIRHGNAKKIRILLERHHKEILLSISDNGSGLPKDFEEKKGMGLRIMRYRTSEMGADVEIHRGAARGTTVTIRCPLA